MMIYYSKHTALFKKHTIAGTDMGKMPMDKPPIYKEMKIKVTYEICFFLIKKYHSLWKCMH